MHTLKIFQAGFSIKKEGLDYRRTDRPTDGRTIIRDAKLRALIGKGPSYREQNFVDWKKNRKICSEAVTAYKHKWSKKDYRVLNEWEHHVNERVEKRIRLLEAKNINKRRRHVLRAGRHLA